MARPGITVDVNFVDDAQTINLNVPFDWTGRDLVNLVGQLVEQGNERQFYGAIEPTPRHLGNIEGAYPEDDTFDDANFEESKHPRGKGQHGGEFVKKGAGQGTSPTPVNLARPEIIPIEGSTWSQAKVYVNPSPRVISKWFDDADDSRFHLRVLPMPDGNVAFGDAMFVEHGEMARTLTEAGFDTAHEAKNVKETGTRWFVGRDDNGKYEVYEFPQRDNKSYGDKSLVASDRWPEGLRRALTLTTRDYGVVVNYLDADFTESEHPRAKGGEFTAGPSGPRAGGFMYHGTNENSLSLHGKEVHLTPSYEQAMNYARSMHKFDEEGEIIGGEVKQPVVHKIPLSAGKAMNIQKEIDHYQTGKSGEHNADAYMAKIADRARSQGYDYMEFNHPNWDGPGTHMVRVALDPGDQMGMSQALYEQESRKKARLTHDDFTESEHPRGQPENKGEFTAKSGAGQASGSPPERGSAKAGKPAQQAKKLPVKAPPGKAGVNMKRLPDDRTKWPPNIQKMVVPPAWQNVHYSPDPNAALQVTGQAQNGKWQPLYHPKFRASQDEAKFARVKELESKFDSIKSQNDKLRKSKDPVTREHADVADLVMNMGLRPGGSPTDAVDKSYGAVTLEGRHVVQLKNGVRLRFVPGKKHGEKIDLQVDNPDLAKGLLQRAAKSGSTGRLFPNVTAGSLLNHFHGFDGGGFKTKDARTLLGTRTAGAEVGKMKPPTNPVEYKKAVKAVCTVVSNKLGNTPAVALASYISPTVWANWQMSAGV